MAIDYEFEDFYDAGEPDAEEPDAEERDEDYDRDLDRAAWTWAVNIARAYAATSRDPVTPAMEAWLARELKAPLAECIGLCIHFPDWRSDYVNPVIEELEIMTLRRPGPRLASFDYDSKTVWMS